MVCAAWGSLRLGALSPADFPFYTWTACAIEDFLSSAQGRPQIDFVGSSLMLCPLGGVDADLLGRDIDAPRHHRSLFFERAFKQVTGQNVRSFNFALPGEMPSDAYLLTKFLLKGDKRPDVIVYGVGPRDFLDNLLPCAAATDPYQYFSRFGDVSDHISLIAPDWQTRLSYELGRMFYTYANKTDLSSSFSRSVTNILANLLPLSGSSISILERRTVLPDYRPFEVADRECLFRPQTPKTRPPFADNIEEYRRRYKQLKWDTYLTQMTFLSDLLQTARDRQTRVVVVSMPITTINRTLLSDLAWDVYKRGIKVVATSKGATFIDLEGSGKFELADFGDTVHLHSGGGAKLLTVLAEQLAANKAIMTALHKQSQPETKAITVAGLKGTI